MTARPHPSILSSRGSTGLRAGVGILAAVTVLGLGATGCGGDGSSDTTAARSSDERETTTTEDDSTAEQIGQKVVPSDSMDTVDSTMQACVGEAFLAEYDEADALALAETADERPEDLTEEQTALLADSLDDCIPGSAFAEAYIGVFYEEAGLGDPDQAATDCLGRAVDGTVGQVATSLNDSGEVPAEFLTALDTCLPPEVLAGLLVAGFTQEGVTESQARCIADLAAGQVTLSQVITQEEAALEPILQQGLLACPAG